MSKEAIAIKALEALARLGNGDQYGNSTGNVIARTALFEMAEQPAQPHMTTNLHDKMLAAIDAYFSASDGDERDQAEEQLLDVRDEINKRKRAEQPAQQEPYGWKVYGVNSLFMGEFAESDAKAEAKRIGGTCITFPLYTAPQPPAQPLTDEQIDLFINGRGDEGDDDYIEPTGDGYGLTDADLVRLVRRVEAAHGITKGNT